MADLSVVAPRDEWVKLARAAFFPGERQACEVCGKYRSLAHAHHIIPLSAQADAEPDHTFVWLCPTHHSAVHLLISQSLSSRDRAGRWQIEMIADMEAEEFRKVHEIFERFRGRT